MPHYLVRWEIDIVAESPQEAAEKARRCQTRAGTLATVFDVYEAYSGPPVQPTLGRHLARIDLTFPEETVVKSRGSILRSSRREDPQVSQEGSRQLIRASPRSFLIAKKNRPSL